MLTQEQRENIIAVAEGWYGTPYRGWTCLKGIGCDCGQLLKGVFMEAGHQPADGVPTPTDYNLNVGLHRKSMEYINLVEKYFREIPESEARMGDVVVYKMGLAFAHAAIIKAWPEHIIHCLNREGVTAGHGMNFKFGRLEKKFFTLKDEHC